MDPPEPNGRSEEIHRRPPERGRRESGTRPSARRSAHREVHIPQPTHVRRLAVLALAGTAASLAGAGSAHAAYTSQVDGLTATLSGSDLPEHIEIGVSAGLLAHNRAGDPGFTSPLDWNTTAPGDQTLPADGSVTVSIDAAGGDDVVDVRLAAANVAQAVVGGGAGDDLVFGSHAPDAIAGGDGDDRLVPGAGDDTAVVGGNGNDTLVWSNGDGSDRLEGEGGADTIEVNGAPTAGDALVIAPAGGRVRLERTNFGPFALDIGSSERLEVNGLGGGDAIVASPGLLPLITLALSGGPGNDQLTGGEGPDLLQGGDGADVLAGGGGDDRVVGGRGGDTMSGGDGDDRLVWNNGDGSDRADGDAGYDTTEVNGAWGTEAFAVAAAGERARLDRVNVGPFAIDMATEVLDLDMAGGDDTLTVVGAPPVRIAADGGSGKDVLKGGDGDDSLAGGSGDDTLTGGAGHDLLEGGDGDDLLDARDGAGDLARCGAGADSATLDAAIVDQQAGCETLDRTPLPEAGTKPGAVQLRAKRIRVRDGRVRLPVRCPASASGGCRGTAVLRTAGQVRLRGIRAVVLLGSARYGLAAGEAAALPIALPRGVRRLARPGTRVLEARVLLGDAAGVLRARKIALTFAGRPARRPAVH